MMAFQKKYDMIVEGLASEYAFAVLLKEFEDYVSQEEKKGIEECNLPVWCFRWRVLVFLCFLTVSIAIGAVQIDNELSTSLLITSAVLFLLLGILSFLNYTSKHRLKQHAFRKAEKMLRDMKKTEFSFVEYDTVREPVSEDMSTQLGIRDGKVVNIPRMLLVRGDTILLRPGQASPCNCQMEDGKVLVRGKRDKRKIEKDEETQAAIALEPVKATVLESPILSHLSSLFSPTHSSSPLDHQLNLLLHHHLSSLLLPCALVAILVFTAIRFYYSSNDSLYGTRFIFAVPATVILPLLCPTFPILYLLVMKWNNAAVVSFIRFHSKQKNGVFYEIAQRCTVWKVFYKSFFGHSDVSPKDLVALFGNLTGVSFVDKKGILSSVNPQIDKVFFYREHKEDESLTETTLSSEVLDLSTELLDGEWKVEFDDPNWRRFEGNLSPIAQNILLNSCSLNEKYTKLVDHVTCVSEVVPRTIAVANRRCACQLPGIIGFHPALSTQFDTSSVSTLGLYKRQPGEAPLPGLTKHRTPLETAFCSIHSDVRSLHLHLSCQGTAGVVLEACSHVWVGAKLRPLTRAHRKGAMDFYQRNSMTGYCLALSYRPVGVPLGPQLAEEFIEVPLSGRLAPSPSLPRSHSIDSVNNEGFFDGKPLKTADEVLESHFEGHIFCGMITLQYQAHPSIVRLVDTLESDCIRFVYFSRENELRSRVFAEKLGLEAGWNCHVSLLEEEEKEKSNKMAFMIANGGLCKLSLSHRRRLSARSDLSLSLDWEKFVAARGSPTSRSISRASGASSNQKVGPMPNKARLPTGVGSVRPHLEEVDNVPLLVGLFTDSTPQTTQEMVDIMQEYGEVVLVVGSSLNTYNTELYNQANLSVCVDPLLGGCPMESSAKHDAKVMMEDTVSYASGRVTHPLLTGGLVSARSIAAKCMGLAVDFHLTHEQLSTLPSLISACRHRLFSLRASLLFLLYSSVALTMISFFSVIFFLPIIFKPDQILVLTIVCLPVLSLSILSRSFQPSKFFIRIAGKNVDHINRKEVIASCTTFAVQFLPTVLFVLCLYYLLLVQHDTMQCSFSDVVCSVPLGTVFGVNRTTGEQIMNDEMGEWSTDDIRHVVAFHTTIYFIVLSASWVHSLRPLWKTPPILSWAWLAAAVFSIVAQTIFTLLLSGRWIFSLLKTQSVVVMIIWSVVIILMNEARKLQMIRLFEREQRRLKLGFDTKLGMNSPY